MTDHIVPKPPAIIRPDYGQQTPFWKEEQEKAIQPPPIENIKYHVFDIHWRERFWSIQCASDTYNGIEGRGHWGWSVVWVLYMMAAFSWPFYYIVNNWIGH